MGVVGLAVSVGDVRRDLGKLVLDDLVLPALRPVGTVGADGRGAVRQCAGGKPDGVRKIGVAEDAGR